MIEPKVRFKHDDGTDYPQWSSVRLSELLYRVNERNNGQFDNTKWISVARMYYQEPEKVQSNNIDTRTYVMRYGDIAFEGHPNEDYKYGRFVLNDIGDGVISELFPIYRFKKEHVLEYWKYAIQIEKIMAPIYRKAITLSGASSNKLNEEDFLRESILVPCIEEQRKIADFLSAVDEVISTSEQEVANLEIQKKAVMRKIFSQEVRFKREDGTNFPEWEEKRLVEVFREVSEKNHPELPVLSIAQGVGTILRDESDRRITYDKTNLAGYKMMKKGDYIIHLRSFEGGLECSNHDGISSPAYRILRSDVLLPGVFRHYFRSQEFIKNKLAVSIVGIRDGKNIDMSTFYEIQIGVPCFKEQHLIADFFSDFDEAIVAAKKELELWKKLKKGLLQKMFV